ncbi:hypothetical protein [Wolbachia endosymbiont of Ctenocephalides felis wCfeT]|uniref:hypothetical protein n=1 Tax=Wolbachia endosymbiont of Ctenocephalides felis wCfeT TaxID=2732593 RepID=UPI00144858B9|nr:hypothetical protein [Wolbachia endosymbiont of Ctenocephalides felis wCfeT]
MDDYLIKFSFPEDGYNTIHDPVSNSFTAGKSTNGCMLAYEDGLLGVGCGPNNFIVYEDVSIGKVNKFTTVEFKFKDVNDKDEFLKTARPFGCIASK